MITAEVVGKACGFNLRSDAWVDYTVKWLDQDIDSRSKQYFSVVPDGTHAYQEYLIVRDRAKKHTL